jgi:DNA polymerase-3 subunit epsilon
MLHIIEQYQLCLKLTGLSNSKTSCFNYEIKQCEGACVSNEASILYNERVLEMIKKHSYNHQNMAIIDSGRQHDERSVILIENGIFKGVGYVNLNFQMNNLEILKNIISPITNNRDTQHIIQSYMRQKKHLKVKTFD